MRTVELRENFDNGTLTFSTKQKGYGRQGLYVNGHHLIDVYPNVEEHFDILHENDSFWDEEEEVYTDCNGNEVDEVNIYTDLDSWLSSRLRNEIEELLLELEAEEAVMN